VDEDITGITVTIGLERVAVQRDAEGWRMLLPSEGEADKVRLIRVASSLGDLRYTRAMADIDNLATFGLQPPQAHATLVFSGGLTIDLTIGITNPIGSSRYVQIAGDPKVYLVSAYSLRDLFDLVQSPPYPPTPIPSPSPVETPTVESTPLPTATPTPTK
jgi:hypothetical protein